MSNLAVWNNEQMAEIRKIFAPTLTDLEFQNFVGLGKSLGLNPFNREIWAVKYNNQCSIFVGRDGYRKVAQQTAEYDGMISDAIYSNDSFEVLDSIPKHTYKLSDRGNLVGAYCVVYRKNVKVAYFKFIELKEYVGTTPIWKSKPATMIIKVAEAQALRGCFQAVFEGTYDESENWTKREAPIADEAPNAIFKNLAPEDLKATQNKGVIEMYNYAVELAKLTNGDPFDEIFEKSLTGGQGITILIFNELDTYIASERGDAYKKWIAFTTKNLVKALQDKKGV